MARIGPVVFTVPGDTYPLGARINSFLWAGSTTPGDVVEIRCLSTNALLWEGRALDINTYQGMNNGERGVHAPNGFRAVRLDSGRVSIYLRED